MSRAMIGSVLPNRQCFLLCNICGLFAWLVDCKRDATRKVYATCMRMERMRLRYIASLQYVILCKPCRM